MLYEIFSKPSIERTEAMNVNSHKIFSSRVAVNKRRTYRKLIEFLFKKTTLSVVNTVLMQQLICYCYEYATVEFMFEQFKSSSLVPISDSFVK